MQRIYVTGNMPGPSLESAFATNGFSPLREIPIGLSWFSRPFYVDLILRLTPSERLRRAQFSMLERIINALRRGFLRTEIDAPRPIARGKSLQPTIFRWAPLNCGMSGSVSFRRA